MNVRPAVSPGLQTLLVGLFLGSLSTWAWVGLLMLARRFVGVQ